MKKVALIITTLSFLALACIQHLTVPAGYRTCRADSECKRGEYCGFVAVDTYAVCKPDESDHL